MSSNISNLLRQSVEHSMTQDEYYSLIEKLHLEEKATGPNPTEAYFGYSKLNLQRIGRIRRTVKLTDELKGLLASITSKQTWLVITESWCGDAAQSIPVYEAAAALSEMVEIRYVLRDENLDLMDRYLTNGGRAIPIVIFIDAETSEELGHWGARPDEAQEYFMTMKAEGLEGAQLSENIQRWYNKDKQQLVQRDLVKILKSVTLKEPVSV